MTRTIAAALTAAQRQVLPAEARLLLSHILARSSAWLLAHDDAALAAADDTLFAALVARRAAGEPIAYLLGSREFYSREFAVTPAVLIPRPETELLVELAIMKVGRPPAAEGAPRSGGVAPAGGMRDAGLRGAAAASASSVASPQAGPLLRVPASPGGTAALLDLGTGSGCLAVTLALELPQAQVTAVDVSAAALDLARSNAARLGASVAFIESDWFAALPAQRFDLIVANPPYIAAGDAHLDAGDLRFEPVGALTDHADGLAAIRRIVATSPDWLQPGGWLLFEHGYDQAAAVFGLLQQAGFAAIEQHRDLAGIVRVSGGRIPDHYSQSLSGVPT